ncbi:MAG: PQQ-dependent sugar dehydrogenase [Phycisphaerales bacterium]|nr:PQQ-dependent sugar dehydrogenase [Planctomycetota bacterium]
MAAYVAALRKTVLTLAGAVCASEASALPPGFADEAVLGNWDRAAGVAFSPDGRCFVWEKAGRVWIVEGGVRSAQPLIDIRSEVRDFGDYGLLGFAIDPGFATNGRIYLLYAADYYHVTHFGQPDFDPTQHNLQRDSIGRITRYSCNSSDGFHSVDPASRKVLVGESLSTGFPMTFQSHGVGTITFAEDGSLLAGSGDAASFLEMDDGGPRLGSSNTALPDGIITPKEDVGAFRSQLVDSLAGKIIRVSPETGDGLVSNPFFDSAFPRAPRSRVWAMGLRNPYRFGIRPGSASSANPAGVLYIGDVGWDAHEELNIARAPGLNFGWPLFEGLESQPLYTASLARNLDAPNPLTNAGCDPHFGFRDLLVQETLATPVWPNPCQPLVQIPASIRHFEHTRPAIEWGHGYTTRLPVFAGQEAAAIDITNPDSPVVGVPISGNCSLGGVWYTSSAFGPEYQNTCFLGDFVTGTIKCLVVDTQNDQLVTVRDFHETGGPIVCIAMHPIDGSLYYLAYTYNGASTLRRISRTSNLPPVVSAGASASYGPSPLLVQFSTLGTTDPEGSALTFHWAFGDGSPGSTEANPVHVFSAPPGTPVRYDVLLTVSDGINTVHKSFVISPNNSPPAVEITSPAAKLVIEVQGEVSLPLAATVSDAESLPGSLTCSWQRILHHNTHTHPDPAQPGCGATGEIDLHGTTGDLYFFEFLLTVTDPQGLSTSRSSSVYPVLCLGDLNADSVVDDADFFVFLASYEILDCADSSMPTWCHADLNRDGTVDDSDFSLFVHSYDRLLCP